MASRKIEDLLPETGLKVTAWLKKCADAGLDILITCTYRSDEEQGALYLQGRSPLAVVNDVRHKAGLAPITEEENHRTVTNARPGQSKHSKRIAADFVPLSGGKPVWDAESAMWGQAGKLAEECGLEWAGRWMSFKELCHVQDKEA